MMADNDLIFFIFAFFFFLRPAVFELMAVLLPAKASLPLGDLAVQAVPGEAWTKVSITDAQAASSVIRFAPFFLFPRHRLITS